MLEQALSQLFAGQAYAFLLTFTRIGTAFTMLPGFADGVVTMRIRLLIALSLSMVATPVVSPMLPPLPASAAGLAVLVMIESFIGLFLGLVARIMFAALDVAGMIISIQTGFAAVMLFNPALASQSSLMGLALSTLGVTLLFVTDLHHMLLRAVVQSYEFLKPAEMPLMGDLTATILDLTARSFMIGAEMAAPFLIVFMLLNCGMGVLQKLAPQIQIFFVMMSVQVALGLFMMTLVLSAVAMFWLGHFEDSMIGFLRS
ncbi:flagellar biosynthetic protein FliR [Arenibaculum pallidiluteum]|uniref:flagellar biosynthetic protein FliR n=1 Tax=Arenibaculum pallidiluteum TaxID=2812559 RepID=UPI001A957B11|nr:flagellar biosynthetic protein FliR [Arenibaculum pallidiluteum]